MRRWKVGERILAAKLGCERIPITGRTRSKAPADLMSNWLAVEVKTRKTMPVFLADAMDQAVRGELYARTKDHRERLPIVVVHADHTHYENSLVVMRFIDADEWFGLGKVSRS